MSEHSITPPTPEMTRSLSYARKQMTRKNEQKDADDLNKQEILEWIGAGPHLGLILKFGEMCPSKVGKRELYVFVIMIIS